MQPLWVIVHDNKSDKILKTFGADSWKGKIGVYEDVFLPFRVEQVLAYGMDEQASKVLRPNSKIFWIASSTVTYVRLHKSLAIPSFMLWSFGYERLMINLHLSHRWDLGITPTLLMCLSESCDLLCPNHPIKIA